MAGLEHDPSVKGSEARLWALIEERLTRGADAAAIDERIWDLFGGDYAVVFTDLSGFSRQVAKFGIIHFLQVIHEQKRLLCPLIAAHDGILIKAEADSFIIIFRKAKAALACAIAMQRTCQAANERRLPEEQILLCVGIGYGHILRIGDVDVFGAEVNAASKLGEDTAEANEILCTQAARDAAGEVPGVAYEPLVLAVPGSDFNYRVIYPRLGEG